MTFDTFLTLRLLPINNKHLTVFEEYNELNINH